MCTLPLIYVSIDNAGLIASRTTPSHHRVDSNGKLSSAPGLPSHRHLDILTFCQPQVSAQSATRRDQNACEHFQHSRATSSKCLTRTKSRVKNASILVCDRGWKQRHCCCQALLHIYTSEPPYLTAYAPCDVSSRGFFFVSFGEQDSETCKIVWHKLHKHMGTIISGSPSQTRIADTYFNPSVGDHGGAKVA